MKGCGIIFLVALIGASIRVAIRHDDPITLVAVAVFFGVPSILYWLFRKLQARRRRGSGELEDIMRDLHADLDPSGRFAGKDVLAGYLDLTLLREDGSPWIDETSNRNTLWKERAKHEPLLLESDCPIEDDDICILLDLSGASHGEWKSDPARIAKSVFVMCRRVGREGDSRTENGKYRCRVEKEDVQLFLQPLLCLKEAENMKLEIPDGVDLLVSETGEETLIDEANDEEWKRIYHLLEYENDGEWHGFLVDEAIFEDLSRILTLRLHATVGPDGARFIAGSRGITDEELIDLQSRARKFTPNE